jgi:hypothetical protein
MRGLMAGFLICSAAAPFAGGDSKKENKATVVEIDGLKATTPAEWIKEKPANRLRSHQFRLPRAKDDKEDAELAISGTVIGSEEEVLKRWKEVFQPPDDKKLEDVTRVDKSKVGKVKLVYMDIHGTYLYKDRPMSQAKPVPKPGYRMLSLLFVSSDGPTRIWVIGPAATVEKHKKGFDDWLKSFK